MFYKPKFCSECGQRIIREEWSFRHSRQYCDLCSTDHQVSELWNKWSVLLIPILLVGSAFVSFRSQRGEPAPAGVQNVPRTLKSSSANEPESRSIAEKSPTESGEPVSRPERAPEQDPKISRVSDTKQRANLADEEKIFKCGAPTKKGTPCTRRVKTPGPCWQHRE